MNGASKATLGLIIVAVIAVFYEAWLRDFLTVTGLLWRDIQTVDEFPYQCRRIRDPALDSCEDMWFDESNRQLYLACSNAATRKAWLPNMGRLNITGERYVDKIIAMDIDRPNGRSFRHHALKFSDWQHPLHALSITGKKKPGMSRLEMWLINNKPFSDSTINHFEVGADSVIELFETEPGSAKLAHVKTFSHPLISSPNNVAPTADGGFYATNDHGAHKAGLQHELSAFLSSGNVVYCSAASDCKIVATSLSFPNGLIIPSWRPDHLYVPSAGIAGKVYIFEIQPNHDLKLVDTIPHAYPIDNLSEDANGDLFVPSFPKTFTTIRSFENPDYATAPIPPASIFRISREPSAAGAHTFKVTKIIEDARGEVLPGATTVIHDAKSGRLFLSGIISPFITVCEPRRG